MTTSPDITPVLEAHILISLTAPIAALSVTDGIEDLLGFKAGDFLTGKVSLKNQIHTHDQDIVDDLFSIGINRTSGAFNIRIRQANGRIRCIKGHYTKKPDASGADVLLELLLQDAKGLSQSRSQSAGGQSMISNFKAMMENTDDYIYFKDSNHVFTGASQTLVTITESTEHWTDLLGLTDYDVFAEDYADLYYNLEKQVFAGILVAQEVQETLDNKGNKGWVDNRKYPIKNEYGEIVGLFGIARVITERKQMEAHNNLLIAALKAAANGIVITDKDATVTWVNPAFGQLTGYSLEEAVGNNPNKLTKSGLQDEAFYRDMWATLLVGQNWRGELINKRKNGSLYNEELSIASVKNGAGEITHFIGIKEDITERKELEAQLQKLASTDPLTGLFNRREFLERLEQERAKVARLPHYVAVLLMLDLDFFKRVNDTYGHATGDAVLTAFAEIALNNSREIDVPARLGGEEFALLLAGADKYDAMAMAERLREQVAEIVIDHESGPVQITVSIGAATLLADDMNIEAVLHRADAALYEAKDRGRNQTYWSCY